MRVEVAAQEPAGLSCQRPGWSLIGARWASRSARICLAETGCLSILLRTKPTIRFLCPLVAAAAFEMIDTAVPRQLRAHSEFAFDRAARRHARVVRKESISCIYVPDSGTALSKQLRRRPIPAPEVLRGHKTALPRLRWPLLPVVLTSGHPLDEHMRQSRPMSLTYPSLGSRLICSSPPKRR